MAKYVSMANAIKSVMEKYSKQFVPIIDPETEKVEDETPTVEPEEPATAVADRTDEYPHEDHSRVQDVPATERERVKADLKRAMRLQHKYKIIDNP